MCFCVASPSSSIYFNYAPGLPAPIPSSSGIFSHGSRLPFLLAVRLKCFILCLFHSLPFAFFSSSFIVSFTKPAPRLGADLAVFSKVLTGAYKTLKALVPWEIPKKCHFSGPTDQPGLGIIFFTLWFPASVISTWAGRLTAASLDTKALTCPASLSIRPPTHTHIKRGTSYPGERERGYFACFTKEEI